MSASHATRRYWAIVAFGGAALFAATLLGVGLNLPRTAQAQDRPQTKVLPDSGLQRKLMIQELRTANKKLDEITKLLTQIRDAQTAAQRDNKPKTIRSQP